MCVFIQSLQFVSLCFSSIIHSVLFLHPRTLCISKRISTVKLYATHISGAHWSAYDHSNKTVFEWRREIARRTGKGERKRQDRVRADWVKGAEAKRGITLRNTHEKERVENEIPKTDPININMSERKVLILNAVERYEHILTH